MSRIFCTGKIIHYNGYMGNKSKRFLIWSLSLIVVYSIYSILKYLPQKTYNSILVTGEFRNLYKIDIDKHTPLETSKLQVLHDDRTYGEPEKFWANLHIGNFQFDIPIEHPYYKLLPNLSYINEKKFTILTLEFYGFDKKVDFSISFLPPQSLPFSVNLQPLFEIPIFRTNLEKINSEQLWIDIFSKDLKLPTSEVEKNKYTLDDLVYNLYVLYFRNQLLKSDVEQITYGHEMQLGHVKSTRSTENNIIELVYIKDNQTVYPIEIKTRKYNNHSIYFRDRFLQSLKLKISNEDDSIEYYSQFKTIKYKDQIGQRGMTLLLASWSHKLDDVRYFKEIINYLRRGYGNQLQLAKLVEFGINRYGSDFSYDETKETPMEKVKRMSQKELEEEIEKVKRDEIMTDTDFKSKDEMIDYYLKKAKESKKNIDNTTKRKVID